MSWKEEFIKRYGERRYNEKKANHQKWAKENPDKIKEATEERDRKGGRYYNQGCLRRKSGIQGERNKIRRMHRGRWGQFKKFIAPLSQLHHQWRPGSAGYDGVALVEKDQHMHGFVDVILILEGIITLFTEKELRER